MNLPPHIALADEPILAIDADDPIAGPDLRLATPVEQMVATLAQHDDDDVEYLSLWRQFIAQIGGSVSLDFDPEGDRRLMIGAPCDAQIRHRWRWLHFLTEDLKRSDERYELLGARLIAEGRYSDNRRNDPHLTTLAIRAFLDGGGRILLDPEGHLTEGGSVPAKFVEGSARDADRIMASSRFYYRVRRRWRSDAQIKRAVRLLGQRLSNGWLELAADGARA